MNHLLSRAAVLLLAMSCSYSSIEASTVIVDANRNGAFGAPLSGGLGDFVSSDPLMAGVSYSVNATGTIDLDGSTTIGPEGISLARGLVLGPFPAAFTPLEEGILDGGGSVPIADPLSQIDFLGAVVAIFVTEAVSSGPGFAANDSDTGGSLDATDLFLVGSGTVFTAPEAGSLWFGINEPFVSNNNGAFTVEVAEIPEPTSVILVSLVSVLCLCRRAAKS